MSRSYPMWFDVTNCNYTSSKSFGGKNDINIRIAVGSSGSNSNHFLSTRTTRVQKTWRGKDVFIFKHSVDGVVLKIQVYSDVNGKPDKLLKTISKLKSIKPVKLVD